MAAKCPICKARVNARTENPAFPFCSERCKTIDLGAWATESYRIPVAEENDSLDSDLPGDPPRN